MKESQKFNMENGDIDRLSAAISDFLTEMNCDRTEIKKYCLIAEDTMLKWRSAFGNDTQAVLTIQRSKLSFGFSLEAAGEKYDPLVKDDDEEYSINQRLVAKIDNDISYKYRHGKNVVTALFCKSDNAYLWRAMAVLMLPLVVQNLLTNIVSASDALMLGVLNQQSLSAVSQAAQITNIYMCLIAGLVSGTTVFASQYWGKRDKESVEKILALTLQISSAAGLIFWILTFFFPQLLMGLLTNDGEILSLGCEYLRITSWAYLCMSFTQVYLALMKSTGRSGSSTAYAAGAMVLNLILNYILIYGKFGVPAMGIKGAALSTVISRLLELAAVIAENCRMENVRFRFRHFIRLKQPLRKDYLAVAAPSILSVFVWGMFQFVAAAVIGHLGADATAANSVGNIVKNLALCFCVGVISGTGIIIGYQLGKSNFDKAKSYSKKLLKMLFASGCVVGLILFALSDVIVAAQTTFTAQAAEYLKILIIIYSLYLPIKSVCGAIASGIISAGGMAKICLRCDIIFTWCILCPILLLATFVIKVPVVVVFILFCMEEVIKLPYFYNAYKKGLWLRNLTEQN